MMKILNYIVCLFLVLQLLCFVPTRQDYLWQPLLDMPDDLIEKAILPNFIDWHGDMILHNENITSSCKNDIQHAIQELKQRKTWAFKLFNSWGRPVPSGLMIGTMTDYGDYDQCLSINNDKIHPQYCLVDISLPVPEPVPQPHNLNRGFQSIPHPNETIVDQITSFVSDGTIYRDLSDVSTLFYYLYIRFGICLPTTCTIDNIRSVAIKGLIGTGLNLKQISCEPKVVEKWTPNFTQTIAIICIITLISITIFSAIYDRMITKKSEILAETVLLWFSPVRNVRKLICTKSQDELTCIHGIRFLTLVWIIIGHTLEWNPMNIFRESFKIKNRLSSLGYQPLFKAHYSVDTFFYLSGLLTSYVTFKYTQGDFQRFRYMPYVLLRYLRLTPQLVGFLLLLSLLPPMFDGPLWMDYMNKVTSKCSKTWWHNLIYMQNLIDVENICCIHTWYLAADMQLHWMSVVLVAVLLKYQRKGEMLTKFLILVCVCIGAVTVYLKRFPPGGIITTKNDFLDEDGKPSDFLIFFYGPWNHASVFFIGFIFGSRLHGNNWNRYILKKSTKYMYWLIAFSGYLFCIYSTSPWLWGRPYDPFWSAVLFPLNRFVWACVLTFVIWLCVTNNGSIIGRLLSWSGFRSLSRMTYSVYLTHVLVFYVSLGTRRNLVDLRMTSIALMLFGSLVMSYLVGFLFTVIFEAPLIHFLEYLKNNLFVPTNDAINFKQNAQILEGIDQKKKMFHVESNV